MADEIIDLGVLLNFALSECVRADSSGVDLNVPSEVDIPYTPEDVNGYYRDLGVNVGMYHEHHELFSDSEDRILLAYLNNALTRTENIASWVALRVFEPEEQIKTYSHADRMEKFEGYLINYHDQILFADARDEAIQKLDSIGVTGYKVLKQL